MCLLPIGNNGMKKKEITLEDILKLLLEELKK